MEDGYMIPAEHAIVSGGDFVFTHLGVCTMKIHRETGETNVLFSPQLGTFRWVKATDEPVTHIDESIRQRAKR